MLPVSKIIEHGNANFHMIKLWVVNVNVNGGNLSEYYYYHYLSGNLLNLREPRQ
jgi:hypothetical protein